MRRAVVITRTSITAGLGEDPRRRCRTAHAEAGPDPRRQRLLLRRRHHAAGDDAEDHRRHRQADAQADAGGVRTLRPRRRGELRVGEVTGLLARWLHLTSSIFLVGGAAALLLAGPSDRPTARRRGRWSPPRSPACCCRRRVAPYG